MTIVYNFASFMCYPCNPYEGAKTCPHPLPNGTCWAVPPNQGPFPSTASANGGGAIRIEDCDIFSNAMWNSSHDINAAFYFAQIPSMFYLRGSLGFQECPWQVDGCEPAGYSMIKVNPEIELGPTGQLSVASAWHTNAEHPPLRFDIEVTNGWMDSRPNTGNIIRATYSHLPNELEPYVVSPLYKSAPPHSGAWVAGQRVWATPAAAVNRTMWLPELPSGVVGWVCVRTGTPGVWKVIGAH